MTTVCFVDNADPMLREAKRVLKPEGALVLRFINRETKLVQQYLSHQAENVFYRDATFYSAAESESLLDKNGFTEFCWLQTLFHSLDLIDQIEALRDGNSQGAFVVVKTRLPESRSG